MLLITFDTAETKPMLAEVLFKLKSYKMTQKEFQELSENEVKELNGEHENKDVTSAWRAGYIYAQLLIRKSFQEDYQDEFLNKVESFIEDDLEEFEAW